MDIIAKGFGVELDGFDARTTHLSHEGSLHYYGVDEDAYAALEDLAESGGLVSPGPWDEVTVRVNGTLVYLSPD